MKHMGNCVTGNELYVTFNKTAYTINYLRGVRLYELLLQLLFGV